MYFEKLLKEEHVLRCTCLPHGELPNSLTSLPPSPLSLLHRGGKTSLLSHPLVRPQHRGSQQGQARRRRVFPSPRAGLSLGTRHMQNAWRDAILIMRYNCEFYCIQEQIKARNIKARVLCQM